MRVLLAALSAALLWPLHLALDTVLFILGLIIVPVLAYTGRYETRYVPRYDRYLLCWKDRLAWLWGNEEDGIDGLRGGDLSNLWWDLKTDKDSDAKRIVKWSALRNPGRNLCFVRPFIIDRKKVGWAGWYNIPYAAEVNPKRFLWHFCWHGWYTGIWITYRGYKFRLGWKVHPADRFGLKPDDYRNKGVPFAIQIGKI